MTLPQRQVSATARCAYSVEKATEPSDEPEPEPEQLTRVESALLSRALTCGYVMELGNEGGRGTRSTALGIRILVGNQISYDKVRR